MHEFRARPVCGVFRMTEDAGGRGRYDGWMDKSPVCGLYRESHDICATAQACVHFHIGFYTQNPSRAETSVCFCRALGVSEHAVFLPNVNSVGNTRTKLRSHGVGGFKNKIAAVRP